MAFSEFCILHDHSVDKFIKVSCAAKVELLSIILKFLSTLNSVRRTLMLCCVAIVCVCEYGWCGYKRNLLLLLLLFDGFIFVCFFFSNKLVLDVIGFNTGIYGGVCDGFLAVQCLRCVLLR